MKARRILFSTPMIRALLEGRKTQTRRIVKPQPKIERDRFPTSAADMAADSFSKKYVFRVDVRPGVYDCLGSKNFADRFCPYGRPGDLLWVKETWRTGSKLDSLSPKTIEKQCRDAGFGVGAGKTAGPVRYEADGAVAVWGDDDRGDFGDWGKTRVSIHMPRWASRLTLRITDVRVQRLQEIGRDDAAAEGFERTPSVPIDPRDWFRNLWGQINGADSWQANPWVWALTFEAIAKNVDQVIREAS